MASAAPGGGFLQGALGAAAGVAGGMLLADSIRGLMGGHASPFGIGSGFGPSASGGERVVNNYYGDAAGVDRAPLADMDRTQDELQDASDYSNASDESDDAGVDSGDDTTDV